MGRRSDGPSPLTARPDRSDGCPAFWQRVHGGGYDGYAGSRPGDRGRSAEYYLNTGYRRGNSFLQPTGATVILEPTIMGLFGPSLAGLAHARRRPAV